MIHKYNFKDQAAVFDKFISTKQSQISHLNVVFLLWNDIFKQTQMQQVWPLTLRGFCVRTDLSSFFPARWVGVCVDCLQSRPCAAAGHLMAKSAAGEAAVTAASASVRPENRGSFMVHAASATTGCAPRLTEKPAMVRKTFHALTRKRGRCFDRESFF